MPEAIYHSLANNKEAYYFDQDKEKKKSVPHRLLSNIFSLGHQLRGRLTKSQQEANKPNGSTYLWRDAGDQVQLLNFETFPSVQKPLCHEPDDSVAPFSTKVHQDLNQAMPPLTTEQVIEPIITPVITPAITPIQSSTQPSTLQLAPFVPSFVSQQAAQHVTQHITKHIPLRPALTRVPSLEKLNATNLNRSRLIYNEENSTVYACMRHDPQSNTLKPGCIKVVRWPAQLSETKRKYLESLIHRELEVLAKVRTIPDWQNYYAIPDRFTFSSREFGTPENPAPAFSMDYFSRGDLIREQSQLSKYGFFSQKKVLEFARFIFSAVHLLHLKGIAHRDIKPDNVFVNRSGKFYLGDFGYAHDVKQSHLKSGAGTKKYAAPELNKTHDNHLEYLVNPMPADIFSIGATLYVLLFPKKEFPELYKRKAEPPLCPIVVGDFSISSTTEVNQQSADALRSLIKACIDYDANKRPTALQALALLRPLP